MNKKIFLLSVLLSSLFIPLIVLTKLTDVEIFIVLFTLSIILTYYGYRRYMVYDAFLNESNSRASDIESIQAEIKSGDNIETPFTGEDAIICSWSIYEWRSQGRASGFKMVATGAKFGDSILLEDIDGNEYRLNFDDLQVSRNIGFFSISRLKRPIVGNSGTRVNNISIEIRDMFRQLKVESEEKPPQRIVKFLQDLRTSTSTSEETSLFSSKVGNRKYNENYTNIGSSIFVRGEVYQSDEFGIKEIRPVSDGTSILSTMSKDEYIENLRNNISVVFGLVISLLIWSAFLLTYSV